MAMLLKLKAEFGACGTVASAFEMAIDLANQHACPVEFNVNGVDFLVEGRHSLDAVCNEYAAALKAKRNNVELRREPARSEE